MKKSLFTGLIALAALTMTSCSNDENMVSIPQGNAIEFGTYVGRDAQTRAHSVETLAKLAEDGGFGVYAYYTDNGDFDPAYSTPNFMKNQKVTSADNGLNWTYSPLKYWPNETNDRLTFFAYAPYDDADYTANTSSGYDNIKFEVNYGDPIVEFTVNGTVKDQQDLVWSRTNNKDIIKNPDVGVTEEVVFNFAHALARIGFTVKAITDEVTATEPNKLDDQTFIVLKKVMLSSVAGTGNDAPTTGDFYTSGKLNLNNPSPETAAAPALWTNCTGGQTFTLEDANFTTQTVNYPSGYSVDGYVLTENTSILTPGNSTIANDLNASDSYIMIIPQDLSSTGFYVYVEYDVVTIDDNLENGLSIVTNHISNKVSGLNFGSGKAYTLNLQLGMTSVKVTAYVDSWDENETSVDLPQNTNL